ncbi:MAG TPA: exo-alpha-sialidase [Thermoplasmata archaeon]|nr:exo-alpha-sialidase [Thermoplasmata archaeon]
MSALKKGTTVVLAGTKKGLYLFHSKDRKTWKSDGPFFEGAPVRHAMLDPRDGKTIWAGRAVWGKGATPMRSTDFGGKWDGPASPIDFKQEGYDKPTVVWQIAAGNGAETYVGLEPAALFRSDDGGVSWKGNEAYNAHPTRKDWSPGNGGLCTHTILPYPGDDKRMLIASSGPAVFGSHDRGDSWRVMNGNIDPQFLPKEQRPMKEAQLGACPHKVVRDAKDPARVYLQHHWGVLTRKRGDDKWTPIERGLPSTFGFPIVAHPHDSGTIYVVPLQSDGNRVTPDGKMRVYRSKNGGKTWQALTKGLPQKDAYFTILRDGMRADTNDPAGIYVGTENGQLYASKNEGDSWSTISEYLPQVISVEAGVVGETR